MLITVITTIAMHSLVCLEINQYSTVPKVCSLRIFLIRGRSLPIADAIGEQQLSGCNWAQQPKWTQSGSTGAATEANASGELSGGRNRGAAALRIELSHTGLLT